MTILIVDDSEDCLELTQAALCSEGYTAIQGVSSAAAAFDFLQIGQASAPADVELILLDIVMPAIDGIVACGHIRSDRRYANVPIIMVTSLADTDSLSNAFNAGANDYIAKPVDRVELAARVRAALKTKADLDRLRRRERELLDLLAAR